MALRGTLGDFGIADIFQLVGHQQKTGILLLKNRELEVRIYFVEGNVVKGRCGKAGASPSPSHTQIRPPPSTVG